MNEFFAADPASCDNASDLRFLLGHFGPQAGRYLAEYPVSWADDIARHCEQLGPVEAERLKVLVRRAHEKGALLRKSSLPWDIRTDWVGNYQNLVRQRPSEFANAVLPCSKKLNGFLTLNDLGLSPTADESMEGIAKEYVRASKTLLMNSPELIFVDPYLNPCKNDRRDVLIEMFRIAAKGKCRKITCWVRDREVVDERRHSWEEVKAALRGILERADWPADRSFRYVLVDDATAKTKMHPRYLLSIKGGIRYDQGFQRLPKGRRNDVSPMGAQPHAEALKTFHEGGHDMRIEREFEYGLVKK